MSNQGHKIEAVIFDLDDTLIDWANQTATWDEFNKPKTNSVRKHLIADGHEMPPADEFYEMVETSMINTWSEAKKTWIIPSLGQMLYHVFARIGLDVSLIDIESVLRAYEWGPYPGVVPYPDTINVLRQLKESNYRLGLLTNSFLPMWMRDVELQAYELIDYLDVRVSSGDIGYLKPHPEIYIQTLNQLQALAEKSVFVGDRPRNDIAGANEVGMISVLIDPPHLSRELDGVRPDYTINSLTELLPILESLEQKTKRSIAE